MTVWLGERLDMGLVRLRAAGYPAPGLARDGLRLVREPRGPAGEGNAWLMSRWPVEWVVGLLVARWAARVMSRVRAVESVCSDCVRELEDGVPREDVRCGMGAKKSCGNVRFATFCCTVCERTKGRRSGFFGVWFWSICAECAVEGSVIWAVVAALRCARCESLPCPVWLRKGKPVLGKAFSMRWMMCDGRETGRAARAPFATLCPLARAWGAPGMRVKKAAAGEPENWPVDVPAEAARREKKSVREVPKRERPDVPVGAPANVPMDLVMDGPLDVAE